MPQVELETLLRVGSGRRVVCETLINPEPDNDPAESFRLPADDEIDWVDRNAALHRNESTKGGAIILNPIITPNSRSNSKRFKSKAHIIGLPKRPDSAQLRLSSRRRPPNIRLFPKPAVAEPESPKVSCIGRIRSRKAKGSGRLGFWARFVAVFGCERKISVEGAVLESEKASSEKKVPGRVPGSGGRCDGAGSGWNEEILIGTASGVVGAGGAGRTRGVKLFDRVVSCGLVKRMCGALIDLMDRNVRLCVENWIRADACNFPFLFFLPPQVM